MKKIFAVIALFFAFVSTSAVAKNDYSCDKKFIFFPGGPEGGPFGTIVYNGAVAAAEHTGCDVDYYWSQWNSEIMIKHLGLDRNKKSVNTPGTKPCDTKDEENDDVVLESRTRYRAIVARGNYLSQDRLDIKY